MKILNMTNVSNSGMKKKNIYMYIHSPVSTLTSAGGVDRGGGRVGEGARGLRVLGLHGIGPCPCRRLCPCPCRRLCPCPLRRLCPGSLFCPGPCCGLQIVCVLLMAIHCSLIKTVSCPNFGHPALTSSFTT